MKTFLNLVSISLFGWLGWKLGASFGLMTGYFVGGLGSIVGFVVGYKVNRMISE